MAVRSTMQTILIPRVRLLINDPGGASQIFADQDYQDVLDESRQDIFNMPLTPKWTFLGTQPQVLDYESELGGWEDGFVLKQYLNVLVTPSLSEPIAGHWSFTNTTLPPVVITGKLYDVYRAAADLLERWAARWVLSYDFTSDGQSFRRSQAALALQNLACTYRKKQRASSLSFMRSDIQSGDVVHVGLGAKEIDYYS